MALSTYIISQVFIQVPMHTPPITVYEIINSYYQLTLSVHGSVTPTRHRALEPTMWAPCGQWDGCDCICHLHRVEQLDQHDVVIQSLVVITAHREM